jgi:hypothetical protein
VIVAAQAGFRRHHRVSRSAERTGRVCRNGAPSRNRRSSSASSPAEVYRRSGSLRRHFRQISTRSRGRPGWSTDGEAVPQLEFLLGNSVTIRGDQGNPIVVGSFLGMKAMSTFHSLDKTDLIIGQFAIIGTHCVVHGGVN